MAAYPYSKSITYPPPISEYRNQVICLQSHKKGLTKNYVSLLSHLLFERIVKLCKIVYHLKNTEFLINDMFTLFAHLLSNPFII